MIALSFTIIVFLNAMITFWSVANKSKSSLSIVRKVVDIVVETEEYSTHYIVVGITRGSGSVIKEYPNPSAPTHSLFEDYSTFTSLVLLRWRLYHA